MNQIRQILIGAACLLSMAASAQWQWVDKAGRPVFSDRAPPADVPDKNILKRPGTRSNSSGAASMATDPDGTATKVTAAPQAAASGPKLSGVDKELLEKKKIAEDEQAAKRKVEAESRLIAQVENCARAKQAKATLELGRRLARINEKGQRQVLDAGQRAAEAKRVQTVIDADCQ